MERIKSGTVEELSQENFMLRDNFLSLDINESQMNKVCNCVARGFSNITKNPRVSFVIMRLWRNVYLDVFPQM
jgi:hypothetical protein